MEGRRRVGKGRMSGAAHGYIFMDHPSETLLVTHVFLGPGNHDLMPKTPTTAFIRLCESLNL
jgi:hypothetical protein